MLTKKIQWDLYFSVFMFSDLCFSVCIYTHTLPYLYLSIYTFLAFSEYSILGGGVQIN